MKAHVSRRGETTVRANKPGESEKTLAIVAIEDTSIRCQGSDFPPGDWRIDVVSRGLVSNSFLDLRVRSVAPTIEIFTVTVLSTNSDMIVPCMDNQIRVDWRVKDASRVTVYRDDTQIDDEVLGGCGGPFEDAVFDTVTGQATYRIEVYPVGGGNSKTSTRTLDEIGIQTLTLYNQSDKWYVIWVYDAAITDADLCRWIALHMTSNHRGI